MDEPTVTDVVVRLRRSLRQAIREGFPQERLPVAQIEVLQHLVDHPGTRSGELAAALRLAPTTASTLVGRLLAAGHVDRVPAPADRRAYALHPTRSGRAEVRAWRRAHESALTRAFDRLSPADRRTVERALPAFDRLADLLG